MNEVKLNRLLSLNKQSAQLSLELHIAVDSHSFEVIEIFSLSLLFDEVKSPKIIVFLEIQLRFNQTNTVWHFSLKPRSSFKLAKLINTE